jgi:hypothetical protein
MIGGKGVETGFYVGEVTPEKNSHIGIKASAIRHRRIGMRALPSGLTILSPRRFREPAHGETVSDIPGDARQLACTVGRAQGDTRERIGHGSFPPAAKLGCTYGGPIFPEQVAVAEPGMATFASPLRAPQIRHEFRGACRSGHAIGRWRPLALPDGGAVERPEGPETLYGLRGVGFGSDPLELSYILRVGLL